MSPSKNRLNLDYADLPDLKAALGGLQPSDRCEVTFRLMVVKNDDGGLEGDIEGVEYDTGDAEGESEDAQSSGEVETDSAEPIMVVIAKRNKSAKPAKAPGKPGKPADAGDE